MILGRHGDERVGEREGVGVERIRVRHSENKINVSFISTLCLMRVRSFENRLYLS